jgi:hypothetical protein
VLDDDDNAGMGEKEEKGKRRRNIASVATATVRRSRLFFRLVAPAVAGAAAAAVIAGRSNGRTGRTDGKRERLKEKRKEGKREKEREEGEGTKEQEGSSLSVVCPSVGRTSAAAAAAAYLPCQAMQEVSISSSQDSTGVSQKHVECT